MRKISMDKMVLCSLQRLSPSGLTRGSTSNQLALLFNLDSRVKPENDSVWVVVKPENDVIKIVPEGDSGIKERVHENDSTYRMGDCGWKRHGAAVAMMSFCLAVGFGVSEALAQCAVPPTCESLGYNKTAAQCANAETLKCPFDTSKVFCNPDYTANAKIGDIYYSDGTISETVIAGKTPVGIIAYINDKSGFVISLEEKMLPWSNGYNNLSCLPDLDSLGAPADLKGAQNTQCIISQTNDTYPTATYCNNYAAVSTGKGSKGWYLPAAGQLKEMSNGYGAINRGLAKLSKTQLSSNYYWSSSEYSYNNAWYVEASNGYMIIGGGTNKSFSRPVRCVLAF